MEKNQKCEETVGQSLSSSSRRVMWKQNGEEETYDSLVNCRRSPVPGLCVTVQSKTSSNSSAHHQEVSTSFPKRSANENWLYIMKEMRKKKKVAMSSPKTSATSLPESGVATYWQHLFHNINEKQLLDSKDWAGKTEKEIAHSSLDEPNLGLRYRPSHESLKMQRCTDHQACSKQIMMDFKMESCSLPPQQSCVVREVAPKFAQRMPTSVQNDTDSCCSGDLEGPKNSPAVKLSNASNSVSHSRSAQQQQRFRSEVISVHVSRPSCDSSAANRRTVQLGSKRRSNSKVTSGNAISSTSSTTAACNKPSTGASPALNGNALFPNFRQRQQELHRYRVQIEQRRLDLLEMKIAREREDALHNEILFHKELQIKENQIKAYEDNDCSNA